MSGIELPIPTSEVLSANRDMRAARLETARRGECLGCENPVAGPCVHEAHPFRQTRQLHAVELPGDVQPVTRKNVVRYLDGLFEHRRKKKLGPIDILVFAIGGPRVGRIPDEQIIIANFVPADPLVAATAALASLKSIVDRAPPGELEELRDAVGMIALWLTKDQVERAGAN